MQFSSSSFSPFLFSFKTWISYSKGKTINFWCPLKNFLSIIFILKFEILFWKMKPFVLGHPWEFFFIPSKIDIFLKLIPFILFFGKSLRSFFFSQSNMSWLSNSFGVLIGGGGWIFWPPFFIIIIFYFFFFTLSSCSIVTIHKHLPFAFSSFPHLSCLENYFSRLPNLISSISQNIFSNLWIIDHICKSFFFLNPFSNFHLCTFMASPRRPTFLLSMGRNIIHP